MHATRSIGVVAILLGGLLAASACPDAVAAVGSGTGGAQAAAARGKVGTTVKALPLKRGFYVTTGTPCGQASTATLLLVTRDGINGARGACTLKTIEQTGASSYRAVESCGSRTSTVTFDLGSDTGFTMSSKEGGRRSARYCPQSALPDPWRDNDISDL